MALLLGENAWLVPPVAFLVAARVARDLHGKALSADPGMNRAGWLTGAAAALGVLGEDLVARLEEATERVLRLGWRLQDVVIAPVRKLDGP